MYELKKNGKVFTSKSVGTGPSSYKKRIYLAAVSQRLRNTPIIGSEFIEWLGDYHFVKKYFAPWYELDVVDSADLFTFLCASRPVFKGEITK